MKVHSVIMSYVINEMCHTPWLYETKSPGSISHYRTQTSKTDGAPHIRTHHCVILKCPGSIALSRMCHQHPPLPGQSSTHPHTSGALHRCVEEQAERHFCVPEILPSYFGDWQKHQILPDSLISVTVIRRT